MKKRKRRLRKFQDMFFSAGITLLILGFLIFLAVSNIRIYKKRAKLKAQIEELKEEIKTLEEQDKGLRAGIEAAGSKEYLEKVAREKFLFKKEGEEVIVITPPEEETQPQQPQEQSLLEEIIEKLNSLRR